MKKISVRQFTMNFKSFADGVESIEIYRRLEPVGVFIPSAKSDHAGDIRAQEEEDPEESFAVNQPILDEDVSPQIPCMICNQESSSRMKVDHDWTTGTEKEHFIGDGCWVKMKKPKEYQLIN